MAGGGVGLARRRWKCGERQLDLLFNRSPAKMGTVSMSDISTARLSRVHSKSDVLATPLLLPSAGEVAPELFPQYRHFFSRSAP